MKFTALLLIGVVVAVVGVGLFGYVRYRSGMAAAKGGWKAIAGRASGPTSKFDLSMLDGQPEIARRYFAHAIAPGTPLVSTVELEMRGTFLLGDRRKHSSGAMRARQILRPPFEFMWIPTLTSGVISITGSDALVGGDAWTRFWLMGLIPVVSVSTSPDMLRSAAFRAASEGVWVPATLLPSNEVRWVQTGRDAAEVTIDRVTPAVTLKLRLAADGALREVAGQRWSNANADQNFRLQPFGGTAGGEKRFGGYTIPTRLSVGNLYGTPDYLPFFQAEIVSVRYH